MLGMAHPGTEIRKRRKAAGLTVEQLAAQAKVSRRQLYRVEAKETKSPGLEFLRRVARALGVDLSELTL